MPPELLCLARDENQPLALGRYAIDFLAGRFDPIDQDVYRQVTRFHTDSIACAVSALACGTNAPNLLRREAMRYPAVKPNSQGPTPENQAMPDDAGATCFASTERVAPEKAVVANCSAVREWDANGTNFGYNPALGNTAGEFGHNDFYPVAVAAAQIRGYDGQQTLRAMILLDEIRGRLAEVFALHKHKIDHVVHGAIASAVVYGAVLGASAAQIESAVGLVVSHYIPFRAIRAGRQLSDSKGASAAISAEVAVLSMRRAMRGMSGPADVFRNPQAIFCLFEPPDAEGQSPFDLHLATSGHDFAVMGMHFKIGLYEHQSAGAIGAIIDLLSKHPHLLDEPKLTKAIRITIYEPAFGIIGDPAKRHPTTRQSADHSMVYIIATLLRKAWATKTATWSSLMLMPADYNEQSLADPTTRAIMDKIEFCHGGPDYDANYPDGIPTTVEIQHENLGSLSSGLVMYPEGHARNTSGNLDRLLEEKFRSLASLGTGEPDGLWQRFMRLAQATPEQVADLYDFRIGLSLPCSASSTSTSRPA